MDIGDLKSIEVERCTYGLCLDKMATISIDMVSGLSHYTIEGILEECEWECTADKKSIERVADYIAASGILRDGLEPVRILDGTWYYATLHTTDGHREVSWTPENRDVKFSIDELSSLVSSRNKKMIRGFELGW